MIQAFIQARMSSRRFPGKVLAPLANRPVLSHVVERVRRVLPSDRIVVATSTDPSDDALAGYAESLGVKTFRGPLEDVFARFQRCLREHPCSWFFRVSADSPLLDESLLSAVSSRLEGREVDLVTNVFPRTFPRGHSVELLRAETFAGIEGDRLSWPQREHLTQVYYQNPDRFRILNVESGRPSLADLNYCVDVEEDLPRLETLLQAGLQKGVE